MLTRLAGGHVIDPVNDRDGSEDIWIRDGRIVAPPPRETRADTSFDVSGKIVIAGGIDIHSHIAGANVDAARARPDTTMQAQRRRGCRAPADTGWTTFATGQLYARMGFTTVVEPAVTPPTTPCMRISSLPTSPSSTRRRSRYLATTTSCSPCCANRKARQLSATSSGWTLDVTRALGIKVVNAGGAMAFKSNVRSFSFDDVVPGYGVTSRQIVKALQRAVHDLGVPHALHVHCNNLGLAGSADTASATIAATEDLPLHLAHLQFYAYDKEGERGFSSAGARLAEAVNGTRQVTIDVGQVMFGPTVTISSDVLRQFNARTQARPNKWVIFENDANGFGIVPYDYRADDFYNAMQSAIGLELFLLITDPWRVFFTTDHPNGAPFTTYPEILALLMSHELRTEWIAKLPPQAMAMTTLPSIAREYSLSEIAIMTRAAPAKLLGLADRGHLGTGMTADIAVYERKPDKAAMFRDAALVFKNGELVVRDGQVVSERFGRALTVRPEHRPRDRSAHGQVF